MIITRTIEIEGEEVDCKVDYVIDSDGIGAYEFWGHKGFDKGEYFIEVQDIIAPTDEQNKWIDKHFDTLAERVAISMEEDGLMEEYGEDYQDDDDAWSGGFADNH